jgi:hypothetical protein
VLHGRLSLPANPAKVATHPSVARDGPARRRNHLFGCGLAPRADGCW